MVEKQESTVQQSMTLVFSYAQEDEGLCKEIETHLLPLSREYQINIWHRHKITPGNDFNLEFDAHLNTAQIILLLVSPDFLASDYCYGVEMQRAIELHAMNSARVIPIIARPSDWQRTPFARLSPLPGNGEPFTSWNNRDAAGVNSAEGVRRTIEDLKINLNPRQNEASIESQSINKSLEVDGHERPSTVFLSYAHEDQEALKELQLRLKVRGVRCWRDADDLLLGSPMEKEIVRVIDHEIDAFAVYITPHCLHSDFVWKVEVPAALRRQERDPQFHIVPILQGVSFSDVQQFCSRRNLPDIAQFHSIVLTQGASSTTWSEMNEKLNLAARRILQIAITLRLRRINADRSYEPWIYLRSYSLEPQSTNLDLDLDWFSIFQGRECVPTFQEWEHILLPALNDVKQVFSKLRKIHVLLQCTFSPAIAMGFTFCDTTKFALFLEKEGESWNSKERLVEQDPLICNYEYMDQGDPQVAVVVISARRDIGFAVKEALPDLGLIPGYLVQLQTLEQSDKAVKSASHALSIALQFRQVCEKLCDQQRVKQIHLFMVGPIELAVFIGQKCNALRPITLYEFMNNNEYKLAGTIHA